MNPVSDMAMEQLKLSITKLGLLQTIMLLVRKLIKRRRVHNAYRVNPPILTLPTLPTISTVGISPEEKTAIIEQANAMLDDENYFFSFRYHLLNITDPWNYDPLEKVYWPKRRYKETRVHSDDTPSDVKIVWEINRFKDLPVLAKAAYLTQNKKYADEIERRLLSWIECNPRGQSVNWSSPLEISIRLISWTASLRLLQSAGLSPVNLSTILRSVSEQLLVLQANLSTDKIVRSNHLIGETAGLYIVSKLYEFEGSREYAHNAKEILTKEILDQTYPDGVSKEASGWYHTFVTDFADIAYRTARTSKDPFSSAFCDRLKNMYMYRNSLYGADGSIVKYGDFDNGRAIDLSKHWRDLVFGSSDLETGERQNIFGEARHITAAIKTNSLFVRAGEFGWGGAGFCSHSHDDFLSPIVSLHKHQILVDSGTYLYNGDSEIRDRFRSLHAHNCIEISDISKPIPKRSFGWKTIRPNSSIDFFSEDDDEVIVEMSYGEIRGEHQRRFVLSSGRFILEDHFELTRERDVLWHFHFHPRWRLTLRSPNQYLLRDFRGDEFLFELTDGSLEFSQIVYEYSSSYRDISKAIKLIASQTLAPGAHHYRFEITRAS